MSANLDNITALLRNTIDSSMDMIQVFEAVRNEHGEIIDFIWILNNKASEKLYGDVIGKSLLNLNPGVVKEGIFDTFKKVVETGEPDQSIRHYVHEQFDGWFLQSTVKQGDGVTTTTKDISDIKRAEEQVRIGKEYLQATLDSSIYVIQAFKSVRDETGKIIDFTWIFTNNRWNEQYGDMIGKSLLAQNPGVVETGLFEKFVEVTETGISLDHEQYYSHEQFHEQWFHQTLVKVGDGFVMNTEDITQRKKAEQEVREKQALLESVLNNTESSIMLLRPVRGREGGIEDFEYAYTNQQTLRSVERDSLAGKKMTEEFPELKDSVLFKKYASAADNGESFKGEVDISPYGYPVWAQVFAQKFADNVLVTYFDITEQKKTEAEIQRLKDEVAQLAEVKYRTLFEAVDEGFAIQELLTDESGNVVDLIYREVNEAFERHTGIKQALGKKVSELVPHLERDWLEALTEVYKTGKPLRSEGYTADLDRWITFQYTRIGSERNPFIAAVFNDITERKRREQRQEYLLRLNEALRLLDDPTEVQKVAMQILGEHLQVDRVVYSDINLEKDYFEIVDNYVTESVQKITGRFPFSAFGDSTEKNKNGETLVIQDVSAVVFDEKEKEQFFAMNVHAVVAVPLIKNGRLVMNLSVHQTTPRQWKENEIALVQETAEHTWAAVERAKAEDELRKSEEKYRYLFNSVDQGFCIIEVLFNETEQAVDYRFLEANPIFVNQTGLENVVGKTMKELAPQHEEFWFEIYGEIARTGEPKRFEHVASQLMGGVWYDVNAFRIGAPATNRVAILFNNITERKQHEERQAFLLRFSDTLRGELTADAVANRALEMLIEYLRLDRSYIVSYYLNKNIALLDYQVGNDRVPPLPSTFDLSYYPEAFKAVLDQRLVIEDDFERQGLSESEKQNSARFGMRAMVAATVRNGEDRPLWSMVAISSESRRWTPNEVQLVEEVAERTWAAIERAKTEESLKKSEEQFRRAIQDAPIPVIMHAEDGEVLQLSRTWTALTGFTLADISNFDLWLSKAYGEGANEVRSYMHNLFSGTRRTINIDFPITALNGEVRHWSFSASSPGTLKDGRRFIVGMAVDITDRKQHEEHLKNFSLLLEQQIKERTVELRQSRDQLQSILDTTLVQMSILEAVRDGQNRINDLKIVAVNRELEKETGRQDLVGKMYAREFPHIKQTGLFDLIVKTVQTGEPQSTEYFYPHKGLNKWFTCMFIKLGDGVVATYMDISDRKKAEEQLRKLEADRQREIFEVSLTTLEEERCRISESLHNGIGQILYAIQLNLSGFRHNMPLADFNKRKNYLAKVLNDSIVETRRISHELMPATLEQFGLQSAIDDICEQLSNDTRFDCRITGLHGRMEKYLELAVYRTAQELMNNVVKHAKATACTVDITITKKDIRISVADNGQGMPAIPDHKPGIGLAAIRSKVKLLRGDVYIDSVPGAGTKIDVVIPMPR